MTVEDWCRWYKAGLREEIQGKLIGVLEPWEFALVNWMPGQAMEAERTLTRRSSPSRALRRKWKWKKIHRKTQSGRGAGVADWE